MMKTISCVGTSLLAALITGCATTPTGDSASLAVPGTRLLATELLVQKAGTVPLTVKRDSGLMGVVCSQAVYLDGRLVAELRAGEVVKFYLPPGRYMLGATATGLCGGGTTETEAFLDAGKPRSYRISAGQDGTLALSPTAF
jgi:hypothetical protein